MAEPMLRGTLRQNWWKSSSRRRTLLGIAVICVTACVWFWLSLKARAPHDASKVQVSTEPLSGIIFNRSHEISVETTNVRVKSELIPVFAESSNGEHFLVGSMILSEVERSHEGSNPTTKFLRHDALIRWRSQLWEPAGKIAVLHRTPESLAWVAQALLPPEKQRWLAQRLAEGMMQFREELGAELEPLLLETAADVMPIVQDRLLVAIRIHQPQIEELSLKYRDALVRDRIVPLIRHEVFPIVQRRASPLLMKIGEEMFERASLWRFTWRLLYDASPLPQRNLVQHEFDRFLRTEGIPILSAHSEELLELGKEIAKDLIVNQRIRDVSREAATELFQDPQLRALVQDCVEEAFEDTTPIRDAIRHRWETDKYQGFLHRLETLLEPIMREIGHELFGSKEAGLTDELVTVLRAQILSKDKEWVVVPCKHRDERTFLPNSMQLVPANSPATYPMLLTD